MPYAVPPSPAEGDLRAILLVGGTCWASKAGGKIRRRHRPLQMASKSKAVGDGGGGKVQEPLRVLGRGVPGCRKLPATDRRPTTRRRCRYMQVDTMRARQRTGGIAALRP